MRAAAAFSGMGRVAAAFSGIRRAAAAFSGIRQAAAALMESLLESGETELDWE